MSNVSGSISVNVEFRDTTASSGVQSLKAIALRDASEYTAGKVAIVTGTAGTAQHNINPWSLPYKDASGNSVSFSAVTRYAFSATGQLNVTCGTTSGTTVKSSNSSVAVSGDQLNAANIGGDIFEIYIEGTAGTCSYTLVMYGT